MSMTLTLALSSTLGVATTGTRLSRRRRGGQELLCLEVCVYILYRVRVS